jgi:hypothetical protein
VRRARSDLLLEAILGGREHPGRLESDCLIGLGGIVREIIDRAIDGRDIIDRNAIDRGIGEDSVILGRPRIPSRIPHRRRRHCGTPFRLGSSDTHTRLNTSIEHAY